MIIIDRIMNRLGYVKQAGTRAYSFPGADFGSGIGFFSRRNMRSYLKQYADAPWVYSCVRTIAQEGAGIPLRLYKKVKKNGKMFLEEVTEHPLIDLLTTVNPFMSGFDLQESTHSYQELTGNDYWLLDEFKNGKPTAIYPLMPSRVEIIPSKTDYIAGYKYEINTTTAKFYPPEIVLHFKYFHPYDDYYGLSPLSAARLAVETQLFGDRFNKAVLQNIAEPGGVLEAEGELSEIQRKRIEESWKNAHKGPDRAGRAAILEGGLKWKTTRMTQKDMDFVNSKKMTREDVLGVFGVPPAMVGIFEYANYANAREQAKIFWKRTMMPKIKKKTDVINSFLVEPYDPNLIFVPDYSGVEELQSDQKILAETDAILVNSGIKLINEAREERKRKPVDYGNTWNAPINLVPITSPRVEEEEPEEEGKIICSNCKRSFVYLNEPEVGMESVKCPNCGTIIDQEGRMSKTKSATKDDPKKMREKIWKAFRDITERWERRFKPELRKFFTAQEKDVIKKLNNSAWKDLSEEHNDVYLESLLKQVNLDTILFARGTADKLLTNVGKPFITGSLEANAKSEIARLNLGIDFDINKPSLQRWVTAKTSVFAKEVNKTTADTLRKELKTAIDAGESIKEAEKRVEKVYNIARGSRTERIARTEIISATNKGAIESYEQSGVVEKKEWIDSMDTEVRDSHLQQGTVKLDEAFPNGLMFPGDPAGGPEEIINCRCTLSAVVERR